ncbi:hypothetical protein BDZ89DRAFT_1136449 [Hymenopellis radicata]|nr:hypothetical protein BDZ89DRAFT_1136449 [Hymenopellis radicata]
MQPSSTPRRSDAWKTFLDAHATETIVKLCDGSGELPLIIIHAGGGSIHAFRPLKEKFSSELWAIQVTPDTPLETLMDQAKFYYQRIKEKQANGPYRFATFSGSSILGFALARIFEQNEDIVCQLALIDHFPTAFLCPVFGIDVSEMTLHHPDARREFIKANVSNLVAMTRRDAGGNLANRLQSSPTPFFENFRASSDDFLIKVFDFLLSLTVESQLPALPALRQWIQKVKAPVSVYLGSYGMVGSLPPEHHAAWHDLGSRQCLPKAHVTLLTAGHYDILGNDIVVEALQSGYAPSRNRL